MNLGDKLVNRALERAQIWASIKEDESEENGKKILLARKNFLKARKELVDYVQALDRTVTELNESVEYVTENYRHAKELLLQSETELSERKQDLVAVRSEIENRNRIGETGPDEIGREYIRRLDIPELTEVFNRTVLGK